MKERGRKFSRSKILAISLALLSSLGLVLVISLEGRIGKGNVFTSDFLGLIEEEGVNESEIGVVTKAYAAACTYNHPYCGWTGPGKCRAAQYSYDCYASEFWCTGYCCEDCCTESCGGCTAPGAPTGYQAVTNNGCTTTTTSCTRYYACSGGSCGTNTATYEKIDYTVTINPNGGSCSGNQNICYQLGSTAPSCTRSGYSLTNYSITSGSCAGTFTASTGVCSKVEGAMTIQANWTANNQAPTAPTVPYTNGSTNPTGVTTTVPYFSAIFNDPDTGNTGVHYQIQVNTNSSFTGTVMWASAKTSMSATAIGSRSPNINYAGTALTQNGATYYWRIKFWDNNGAEGAWSAVANFTMNTSPSAPSSLLTNGSTNPTGVTTVVPYFSAIFNDPDSGNTGVYYQIQVNTNSSFTGTTMWAGAKTAMTATARGSRSPNINYGGAALTQNGATYYWRIKFWDNNGAEGVWSSAANFTMSNPRTVTYTRNNESAGSLSYYSKIVEYGTSSLAPTTVTNAGYDFNNFTILSGNCAGVFNPSTGMCSDVQEDITIQANWSLKTYTLSYTRNNTLRGELSYYSKVVDHGSSSSPAPTVTTNTGYDFNNFVITSGSCAGTFTASTGVCSDVQGDITIQANWSIIPYTVTYTRNNTSAGTLSYYSKIVNHASSSTPAPTVITNAGYTFNNFTITSGSCAGIFTASTGVCSNVQGNITIEANWTTITYTLTYTRNNDLGGELSYYSKVVDYGSSSAPRPTVTTNTGYGFNNFTIISGSCAGTFNASTGVCSNVQGNMTIQANWLLETYTVTYTRNNDLAGDLSYYSKTVSHGNSSSPKPTVTTNTGYNFNNFTIISGSCEGEFDSSTGECSDVQEDITIQANWSVISYIVTYTRNNTSAGSLNYYSKTVDYGSPSSPAPTVTTNVGYDFNNFTITSGSCAGEFDSSTGECSDVQEDITIEGNWSVISYTVTYTRNNDLAGGLSYYSKTVNHGSSSALGPVVLTTLGYSFNNFTITSGRCSGEFDSLTGECSDVQEDITIQGNWSTLPYTLTYTRNNTSAGELSYYSKSVEYGSSSTPGPTVTTNTGYDFNNFTIISGSCTGEFDSSTGECSDVQEDITIQANWSLKTFTIQYDGNGGTCTPSSRLVTYGSNAEGPSCSQENYSLAGFVSSEGSGGTLDSITGEVSNVTGDQTVRAEWTALWTLTYTRSDDLAGELSYYSKVVGDGTSSSAPIVTTNAGYDFNDFTITSGSCAGEFDSSTGVCSDVQEDITIRANWTVSSLPPILPTGLRVEDLSSPTPSFRAIFNSPDEGSMGEYYHIQVNTEEDFTGIMMWDSGKTSMLRTEKGSQSPAINYAGAALVDEEISYYWRIKFWDNNDTESPWSGVASFVLGASDTNEDGNSTEDSDKNNKEDSAGERMPRTAAFSDKSLYIITFGALVLSLGMIWQYIPFQKLRSRIKK